MEQVEGGDLIVNRGEESRPKDTSSDLPREMNAVDGYEGAYKLAQVQDLNDTILSPLNVLDRLSWTISSRKI
jgi:hypothetical protein